MPATWAIYSGWDWVRDYYSEEPAYYLIWCGDWQFGYYGHLNFDADQLIRNTDLLVVFAASNDRENAFLGPHRIKGTTTGALMLKNLLIHSARDAGNPGPDYAYGYGTVDAELAAKIIKNDETTKSLMIEDSLDHNDTKRYTFDVPEGTKEMRASLVWHDVPNETLVNDLDLRLEQGEDNIVLPFVLDPENPSALAVQGQNTRYNVEYVRAENPRAGPWKIGVRGSSVPGGPQKYSLIVSAGNGNTKPITQNEGNFTLRRVWATNNTTNYDPVTTFHYGDNLHLISEFIVTENVDYGGWWGTISELWQVIDPQGNDIIRVTLTGDRCAPGNTPYYSGIVRDFIVPRTMPAGTYTLKVTMTMHNSFSQSAEYQFKVARKIYPLNL